MPKFRPRQTQLSFQPLPESSPAKDSQHAAIRERAAAVTISPSQRPRKRAKISDSFLPTPETSSQRSAMFSKYPKNASSPLPVRSSFMSGGSGTRGNVVSSPIRKAAARDIVHHQSDSSVSDEPIRPAKRSVLASSPIVVSDNDRQSSQDSSEDSDELPALTKLKPQPKKVQKPTVVDDDDSDESPRLPSRKTQSSQVQHDTNSDEDGSESDEQPVKKRRRLHLPSTPRKRTRQEDLDLEEDLDFLEPTSPETPRELRNGVPSEKKHVRQTALDALKRRRQNANGRSAASSSNPQAISDDSEAEQSSDDADDDEEAAGGLDVNYEEEEEEDFVVENDADDDDAEIPFEFKLNLMKTRELFKFAVEWMCQKRLNPAFAIDDDVYTGAFRRLDDFVRGMGGSQFQSAAWTPKFIRALKARPAITETHFTNDGLHDRCDACNRSGHPPTWEVQLSGAPYDKVSLEDVSEDEDEDAWKETKLPSSDVVYYLGKFCMANAHTAHALAHWRHHLHQWVEDYLEAQGHLSAKKVLKRDKWNTKKRGEYANGVVDRMEESGEIQGLYRDFKGQIETAQNQTQRNDRRSSP